MIEEYCIGNISMLASSIPFLSFAYFDKFNLKKRNLINYNKISSNHINACHERLSFLQHKQEPTN